MTKSSTLLFAIVLLGGCSLDEAYSLVDVKRAADSLPDCSQNGKVLNCDWDNVTDDWLNADPSEFNSPPPSMKNHAEKGPALVQHTDGSREQADKAARDVMVAPAHHNG